MVRIISNRSEYSLCSANEVKCEVVILFPPSLAPSSLVENVEKIAEGVVLAVQQRLLPVEKTTEDHCFG